MRQVLFHIPHELRGVPIFGRGWLLIVWAVLSVLLMIRLVRRQGWSADTRSHLPALLVIGAVIAFVAPFMEKTDLDGRWLGLQIPGFGVMLLTGILCGVALAAAVARPSGVDPETVYSVSFWMVLAGIVGARVFYVVEYWPQFQRARPAATAIEVVNFTKGGIVVYGALIGGLAAALVFARLRKLPPLVLGDVLAPGMVLGLAIGRIGCLLNGCCYGGVCELSAAPKLCFPAGSPAYIHQQRLGQLHGIRIGEDAGGRVVIERVESGQPAGSTSLRAGDVVKSLQLPARRSLDAAQRVAEFAGAALEIETADGQKKQLLIERRSPSDYFAQNDLGFQVQSGLDGPPGITEVAPGGPAQRAGFRVGDELKSIRLPPLPNVEAAENVLQCAGARLTVETEDGRSESWTVGKLRSRSLPVHPTQIYSSINAALLCLLLCAWRPLRRRDGEVVALMLTLYPITRIVEEAIRDDEPGVMGSPLTISQIVSLMALLAAAALWVHLVRRPRRGALAGGQPA